MSNSFYRGKKKRGGIWHSSSSRWLNGSFFAAVSATRIWHWVSRLHIFRSMRWCTRTKFGDPTIRSRESQPWCWNQCTTFWTWYSRGSLWQTFTFSLWVQPLLYVYTDTLISKKKQVILTSALEGSAFNVPHIDVLNTIARVRCFHPYKTLAHSMLVWLSWCFGWLFHLRNGKQATRVCVHFSGQEGQPADAFHLSSVRPGSIKQQSTFSPFWLPSESSQVVLRGQG